MVEIAQGRAPAVEAGDRHRPLPIDEDAQLRRRLLGVGKAEAGRLAERNGRAAHHGDEPERARTLGDDLRIGHQKGLAQALELRKPQRRPGSRWRQRQAEGEDKQAGRRPAAARAAAAGHRQGRRQRTQRSDNAQGGRREDRKKQGDDSKGTRAGSHQVVAIDTADAPGETGEGKADAVGRAEERNGEERVKQEQIDELVRIPDQRPGVERQALGKRETGNQRDAEERGIDGEDGEEAVLEALAEQGQEGAAGAIAEQRDADHHVGEVVHLHDREQTRQQDLRGEHAR